MKNTSHAMVQIFSASLLLLASTQVFAQAYCALRDPVETIRTLFPESTSQRSIVRVIGEQIRRQVQDKLPPNTLHFGELGQHTLYVVFRDKEPLGFVHVRSEESDWGLVEVAWALEPDLRIRDFRFQRCRSRQRTIIESEEFRRQLRGLNFGQVIQLLKSDGRTLNPDRIRVAAEAKSLAEVVLRCALKTMIVTELAWEADVRLYQSWHAAALAFENVQRVELVSNPLPPGAINELDAVFGGAKAGIARDSVSVARVFGEGNHPIGAVYEGTLVISGEPNKIEWTISPDHTVLNITNPDGWPDEAAGRAFKRIIGSRIERSEQCAGQAELTTLEAVITASHALRNQPAREPQG